MIITCAQMQAVENCVFLQNKGKITAEILMEQAGLGIANALLEFFPKAHHLILAVGKGHNSGDAYVAARHLLSHSWSFEEICACRLTDQAELTKKKRKELFQKAKFLLPIKKKQIVVLDGLLGIGAKGKMQGAFAKISQTIKTLRNNHHAKVVAIDLPSGLVNEQNPINETTVTADFTFCVGLAKDLLLRDEALSHVGRLIVIRMPVLEVASKNLVRENNEQVFCTWMFNKKISHLHFDEHKAKRGRIGIIAGSKKYPGAARLAAEGALRAGAGLVFLFVKKNYYKEIVSCLSPEIIICEIEKFSEVMNFALDSIVIGPGLDRNNDEEILKFLENEKRPLVVDADALNAIGKNLNKINIAAREILFTPHPGEMQRLFPNKGLKRSQIACEFIKKFPQLTLLFKGARSIVCSQNEGFVYNTSGTSGMASGGMGDVLSGVCASLKLRTSFFNAAAIGSWLIGRAGEIAIKNEESDESLRASSVLKYLGCAFKDLYLGKL